MEADATAPTSPARAPRTNLPRPLTSFLGRERELQELLELLLREDVRLLTLTGPGGAGKTRLALEAAAEMANTYADGAFWVDLAPLSNPELVLPAISRVVGAKDDLATHIGDKEMLLALDNLEHLVESASELSALLASSPKLTLLVTSREPLHLSGEHEYPVPPLNEAVAVALFIERARQHEPGFEPVDAVSDICRRLDGLPLALELAAARVKVLTSPQILDRLAQSLDFLTTGARDAPARHRTLRATIEWSYELLSSEEQTLFARLAVFAGSFGLEAAEAICEAELDTLASLVDKSLLRQTGQGRFFMLATIREFSVDRLGDSQERDALRDTQAKHFRDFAEERRKASRYGDPSVLDELDLEYDNLRAALEWSAASDAHEIAVSLLSALWVFWIFRGYGPEGYEWSRRIIDASRDADPAVRLLAWQCASEVARFAGDAAWAQELKDEVVTTARLTGDENALATTLVDLSGLTADQGKIANARQLAEEAMAIRLRMGGDDYGIARVRCAIAHIEFVVGNFVEARRIFEETNETFERTNRADLMGNWLMIGECLRREGNLVEASQSFRDALAEAEAQGSVFAYPELFQEIAALAQASGDTESAATLLGASDRLYDETRLPVWAEEDRRRTTEVIRATIGDDGFEAARARGAVMDTGEAIDLARATLD